MFRCDTEHSEYAMALVRTSRSYHNLYNTKHWRRLRYYQLLKHPLCALCLPIGIMTPAKIVDHVTPHKGNEILFYNADNLQSLCKQCHDKAKATIERKGYLIGCDVNGNPVDKNSHWNK